MDNKMLSEALISMLGAGNVRTGELMKTDTHSESEVLQIIM